MNAAIPLPGKALPRNPRWKSVDRACVRAAVYSRVLGTKHLNDRLGEATRTHERSDTDSRGQDHAERDFAGWIVDSEGHVASCDVRDHLDWMLRRLSPYAEALAVLQGDADCVVRLTLVLWISGGAAPVIDAAQTKAIGALGFDLHFDIADHG